MKLLFDQNLSRTLVASLGDVFPESAHVRSLGLSEAADSDIWDYAGTNGFAIVSKDSDFQALALTIGPGPKVIHIAIGNCSTRRVEEHLRRHAQKIIEFLRGDGALLIVQ